MPPPVRCSKRERILKHRLFPGRYDRADRFEWLKTDTKRRALLLSEPRPATYMGLKILREQRADGVEHCQDHYAHIGKHRQPHIGEA